MIVRGIDLRDLHMQHFACFNCRKAFKQQGSEKAAGVAEAQPLRPFPCPECGRPMAVMGRDFGPRPSGTAPAGWSPSCCNRSASFSSRASAGQGIARAGSARRLRFWPSGAMMPVWCSSAPANFAGPTASKRPRPTQALRLAATLALEFPAVCPHAIAHGRARIPRGD